MSAAVASYNLSMPYYFAYGSNLNAARMTQRCPGAKRVGRALLKGWRYLIYARGYANVVPDAAGEVWGGVWEVTAEHLRALDGFEGIAKGFYHREEAEVILDDDTHITSVFYADANEDAAVRGVPEYWYQDIILQGAREFGLPEDYLAFLLSFGAKG